VALCAGAAKIDAIQFPTMAWKNLERLEHEAREAAILGYAGKIVIHPDQIPVVNRLFSPSPERIAWAREVISKFEATRQAGGAIIKHDSQMMDAPHVKQCQNILEKARRAGLV
jgi:citrate lyase beta subunit